MEPITDTCEKLTVPYVNPVGVVAQPNVLFHTALRSYVFIVSSQLTDIKKKMTVFNEPLDLANYGILVVVKGHEMNEIRYKAAVKVLYRWAMSDGSDGLNAGYKASNPNSQTIFPIYNSSVNQKSAYLYNL